MGRTVYITNKQLDEIRKYNESVDSVIEEAIDELMISPMSKVSNKFDAYVIVFRGNVYIVDYNNRSVIKDIVWELSKSINNDDSTQELINAFERSEHDRDKFDWFVNKLGFEYPYILTGEISDYGRELFIHRNSVYDVMHSKELKQLCDDKRFANANIYYDFKVVRKAGTKSDVKAEPPKTMYHGTLIAFALNILKKGLRPSPGNTSFNVHHSDTVFITSDYDNAEWYAKFQDANTKVASGKLRHPCILEIDTTKLDDSKFVLDYDIYNSHVQNRNDSIYNSEVEKNYLSYNRRSELIRNATNPRKFKRVGYRGIIMPSAITGIYIKSYSQGDIKLTPEEFVKTYGNTDET